MAPNEFARLKRGDVVSPADGWLIGFSVVLYAFEFIKFNIQTGNVELVSLGGRHTIDVPRDEFLARFHVVY